MGFDIDWGLVREIAAGVVVAAALVTAIGVLAKSTIVGKPIRWLWRRNISQPLGSWAQDQVREVVDERVGYLMTHNNGGSSLKDLADGQKASKEKIILLADEVQSIKSGVTMLLAHDAERDQEGKRYGEKDTVEVIVQKKEASRE